jgi:hypothetical protein
MYPNYKSDHKQNREFFLKWSSLEKRARTSARVSPVFFQAKEMEGSGEAAKIFF